MHQEVDPRGETQGAVVEIRGGARWTQMQWASIVLRGGTRLTP
jgi:hypothetical protein